MARGSSVPLPIMMVFAPPFMLLISALSLIQFASMYKSECPRAARVPPLCHLEGALP